jgi:hypothetical protein
MLGSGKTLLEPEVLAAVSPSISRLTLPYPNFAKLDIEEMLSPFGRVCQISHIMPIAAPVHLARGAQSLNSIVMHRMLFDDQGRQMTRALAVGPEPSAAAPSASSPRPVCR